MDGLPTDVIDKIVSFVMVDRLMSSPTAKIMKSYFNVFVWDVHEFYHDLLRSRTGIHNSEIKDILNAPNDWFKNHVLKNVHLYQQIMRFFITYEYWDNELIEWILTNSLLMIAISDNCPTLKAPQARVIDFCECSMHYWYVNQYYEKLASDHKWDKRTPF